MKRIHLLKKTLRDDIIRALDAGGFYPPGKVETRRGATVRVVARDRDAPAGLRVITETPDRVNEAFGGDVVPLVRELTHVDTIDEALATADLCAVLDAIAPLADDAEWPDGVRAALAHFVGAIEVTGGILRGDGAPVGDPEWPDLGDAYVRACAALGVPVAVNTADDWCRECSNPVRLGAGGVINHLDGDGEIDHDVDADHVAILATWPRLEDGSIPAIRWVDDGD